MKTGPSVVFSFVSAPEAFGAGDLLSDITPISCEEALTKSAPQDPPILQLAKKMLNPGHGYSSGDAEVFFNAEKNSEYDVFFFYRLAPTVASFFSRHYRNDPNFDRAQLTESEIKLIEVLFNEVKVYDAVMTELSDALPGNPFLQFVLEMTPAGLQKAEYLGHIRLQRALLQFEKLSAEGNSRLASPEEQLVQSDQHSRRRLKKIFDHLILKLTHPHPLEPSASKSDIRAWEKKKNTALNFYHDHQDEVNSLIEFTDKILGKKFKPLLDEIKLKVEEIKKILDTR